MSEPFIAEIRIFAGNFAPRGWAFCWGQLMAISQNTALYSLVGTTYGGDGRTTFGIPDLRGRSAIHAGRGPGLSDYRLGQKSGLQEVSLNSTQLPAHQHGLSGVNVTANNPTADVSATLKLRANSGTDGDVNNPGTNSVLGATPNEAIYVDQDPDTDMRSNSINTTASISNVNVPVTAAGVTDPAGGSGYHQNMHPWLSMYYIISLLGTYPSRS